MPAHNTITLLLVLTLSVSACFSLQCYSGSGNQVTTIDIGNNGLKCVRYQFKCTPGDGSCSSQDIEQGTTKWAYAVVSDSTCSQMVSMPQLYSNVYCCNTDLCNQPLSGTSNSPLHTPRFVVIALNIILFLLP
jgi:hypothetical protein